MKISHTREIITPFYPCGMEGYSEERFLLNQTAEQKAQAQKGTRIAQGARDDLLMETLVMEAGETVVFFVLDMIIAEKAFTDYCRRRVSEASGLLLPNICISCIHTHNSPLTSHGMDGGLRPDPEYWEMLADKMIFSLRNARRHLRPARLYLDEFLINGYYNNRNHPDGSYFNKCLDLTFCTEDNTPLVRLLNLACHPSLIGVQNRYFTADFFGVLRRYLQGVNGTPVMLFNGEAGDVSPRLLKKGVDWNECVRYGEGIGAQLAYPNHPREIHADRIRITEINHRIRYRPTENPYLLQKRDEIRQKLAAAPPGTKEYENLSMVQLYDVEEKLSHEEISYEAPCYIYDLGGFRIVTVPCEIDTVLGGQIRARDDKPTFLNAYANGFLYYAVNQSDYGNVFESFVTCFPYGDADRMVSQIVQSL